MTDFKKPVPDDRTVVPGIWSDVLDDWASSFFTDGGGDVRQRVSAGDFLTEVAKGNVAGHSLLGFQQQGEVGTTYTDIWGGVGDMVYPASSETWEIVSDSANDTFTSGSGAWTVVVTSLDENKALQTTIVNLNGLTPVTLDNLHSRPQSATVISAGSSEVNEGEITLRAQGGGNVRNVIPVGLSTSYDGHFTVPANTDAFLIQTFILYPKNISGDGFTQLRDGSNPNSAWITSGKIPLYQNMINFNVLARFPLAPESDIRVRARTETGTAEVTLIYEYLLVERSQ